MASSLTSVLKLDPASLRLLMSLITKKKLVYWYLGITLPLGKCQMPKTIVKGKWKIIAITSKRIFSILQYGLY